MGSCNHVAIIMDGNGRWAQKRRRPRIWGHIRGSFRVADIIQQASDSNVKALTLYAFSTENWARPPQEITLLFLLLKKFLLKEKQRIFDNGIRFKILGDISVLPSETQKIVKDIEAFTKESKGLKLTFAFNYGGRAEIVKAVNSFMAKYPGRPLDEETFSSEFPIPDLGEVDLLIRTGGDQRISNFLLWHLAYAELCFIEKGWPEFSKEDFVNILNEVTQRERRFGSINEEKNLAASLSKAKKKDLSLFAHSSEVHH